MRLDEDYKFGADKDKLEKLEEDIFLAEWIVKDRLKQRKKDIIDVMPTLAV